LDPKKAEFRKVFRHTPSFMEGWNTFTAFL